ncbi:uncharacterized protein LOC131688045 [Topomyia yanbarensis]|uniref:uncharacterized protein LOC131688045 n=1 Tax=Topomyia yanbarensis TaxID=2498891 RepID=UPI00273C30CD|nr:uncharacterized protein LOC131688045 [Topomyia yanbarensis]
MGIFGRPVTIQLKYVFQELWRLQSGCDDVTPDGLVPRRKEWSNETAKLGEIRPPRYYYPTVASFDNVELHAFCDTSDKAFACVIYIGYSREGKSHVDLVYAKSRVAPLKAKTVPWLEQLGCVLAKLCLCCDFFWCDSKFCWSLLNTNQKLTAYVGDRVMQIKENAHGLELWPWMLSQLNEADLATKCAKFGSILECVRGPDFIYRDSINWPNCEPLEMLK